MTERADEPAEIKETDIVFDCPHCSKSLAIDYRGAGLTIPCTDCGKNVQVPIPEGMEITDIDSSEEEQEVRILNLRRSLAAAEAKIEQLSSEVEEITTRRETLEKVRTEQMTKFSVVMERVAAIQKSVDEIHKSLGRILEAAREEVR